jgi:hypothetical protein
MSIAAEGGWRAPIPVSARRRAPKTLRRLAETPVPGRRRPDFASNGFADLRWLEKARQEIVSAGLRRHARRNALHVAELIAHHCDGKTLRSRPTLAVLVQESGLSLRTVQRWCRWWERAGFLAVIEDGVTPRYAPDRLRQDDENQAREWHLIEPDPELQETVTPSHAYGAGPPRAPAEDAPPGAADPERKQDRRSAPDSSPLAPPPWRAPAGAWPLGQTPQRRRERLTAVQTLQRRHMVLRRLSARRLRSILRPWFGSHSTPPGQRWTPADVLYALDHRPGGRGGHEYAAEVRDPAGWLAHRLGFWLDQDGEPMRPHSAELADRAAEHAAETGHARAASRAAEDARLAPAAAGYGGQAAAAAAGGASLARQLLTGRDGTPAAALRRHELAKGRPPGAAGPDPAGAGQ